MKELLALARKVSEADEVYMVSSEETPVRFEANRLKSVQSRESVVIALRVIKNGRTGYAVSTGLDNIQRLVDNALDTARFGIEARFEFPGLQKYPAVKVYDKAVLSVPIEEMIKLGEGMIEEVRRHNSDVLCSGSITKSLHKVRIINSRGGEGGYEITTFGLGLEGTLVRGTDMLFVGDFESSCHPVTTDSIVATVKRQLNWAKDQAETPTKPMPVIFTPDGVASTLIAPLTSAFNGKTVLLGASPLCGRIGEVAFDKKFTLYDDTTVPYRPGSRPCDDEGIPSQKTPLIHEGKVMGFFYDLQTAGLAKVKSTGNGERGRGSLPQPSPGAFVLREGKTSLSEMIGDVKEGILIENVMGAEMGNILSGDFSGNVLLGYKIEKGEVAGRVKDTMVFGNVYELLKDIAGIGSDGKWVASSLFTPSIYCPKLSVAAK